MTPTGAPPSEPPVLEIGEEDILLEEDWLDGAARELGAAGPEVEVMLARAASVDGFRWALAFDASGEPVGGPPPLPGARGRADVAALWTSVNALASRHQTRNSDLAEELLLRTETELVFIVPLPGPALAACFIFERQQTNEALVRMSLAQLTSRLRALHPVG